MELDLEALIRAVVISVASGLIVRGIIVLILGDDARRGRYKAVVYPLLLGMMIVLAMALYYIWPSLVEVPSLGDLSEDSAIAALENAHLIPEAVPRISIQTETGRVIPGSQSPIAGQLVKRGRTVTFAVSTNRSISTPQEPDSLQHIAVFHPRSGEPILVRKDGTGAYGAEITGSSSGLVRGRDHLLLWVRPVNPPSDRPGWYLQRPPQGIATIRDDGTWIGLVRFGNADYPPNDGHTVDVALSMVDRKTYEELMGQSGEAVSVQPVGALVEVISRVQVRIAH